MFGCFFKTVQAAEKVPQELQELYARSAVLMDGRSGRILFSKNADEVLPMASTTKIMTCILALEYGKLDEKATVSANAAAQPEVKLGVKEGEEYYLKDLLYSLMLESHNDSAVVIAEHIGGSVEGFAQQMNQKAKEIGCIHTHYVTPNGLDQTDEEGKHSTTAKELGTVMSYCISDSEQKEQFLEITGTRQYSFQNVAQSRSFTCYNHNQFLDMMEGAISGKTGFTSAAGYCYVGALKRENRVFVVALLACGWPYNRSYKWQDTKKLMEYGLQHYENQEISCELEQKTVKVIRGKGAEGNPLVQPEIPIEVQYITAEKKICLVGDMEKIRCQVTLKKTVDAPVAAGTVVGKVCYYVKDVLLAEEKIVTMESMQRIQMKDTFFWLMKYWCF